MKTTREGSDRSARQRTLRPRASGRPFVGLAGAAALVLAIVTAPGPVGAQDRGSQLAPPQDLVLVSKDVGDERWAIALDLRTGTATGNVFPRSGGAPWFLWCSAREVTIEADPKDTSYTLDCFGASACPSPPCDITTWNFIQTVELSGSFLFSP